MNSTERTNIDCKEIGHVRSLWVHEDNLINQRMTWLGFTQTILFAALGGLMLSGDCSDQANLKELIIILPMIGLATSILIFLGILAAILAMLEIKNQCSLECLGIKTLSTIMGFITGLGLPIVFVFAWLRIIY